MASTLSVTGFALARAGLLDRLVTVTVTAPVACSAGAGARCWAAHPTDTHTPRWFYLGHLRAARDHAGNSERGTRAAQGLKFHGRYMTVTCVRVCVRETGQ